MVSLHFSSLNIQESWLGECLSITEVVFEWKEYWIRNSRFVFLFIIGFFFFSWRIYCFKMCQFLLHNNVNQLSLYIQLFPLEHPFQLLPSAPYVIIERRAELLTLDSSVPLSVCFIRGSVSMPTVPSQFGPPSLYATVSVNPFSTSIFSWLADRFISTRCGLGSSLGNFFSSKFISQVFIFFTHKHKEVEVTNV